MSSVLKKPVKRICKRLTQRTSDDERENKPFLNLKKPCIERRENAKKLATVNLYSNKQKKKKKLTHSLKKK